MKFENLLSRADDEILQELLGQGPLNLLSLLDPSLLSPSKQKQLLLKLKRPQELLQSPMSRRLLLELLRPEEAAQLSRILGAHDLDDPYNFLASLSLRGTNNRDSLLSFFELPVIGEEIVHAKADLDNVSPKYPLFPFQRESSRKISRYLESDPYRVVLHMPTGSGKTRTAIHVVAEHLNQKEPTVIVWLANSEELCEQAVEEFIKAWQYLGNRTINVVRFWGEHQPILSDIRDGFVVAGLQKTVAAAKKSLEFIARLGRSTSLVVMDEAHQAVAPSYQMILEALVDPYPGTQLLGLTATPGRTWGDVAADEVLAEFFALRKVTLSVPGYDNPIDFLVSKKYLADAKFRSLFYNSGLVLTSSDLKYIEDNLDLPRRLLELLANDQKRNLCIILEIEKLAKSHDRIIVFALSVEHSNLLAAVLQARGQDANSITSKSTRDERRRVLNHYKSDDPGSNIVCNYGVLTTGFDAPRTSAAVIARPTESLVLYSQMVGRAIRGRKAGGNDTAEIVTVVDAALPGFGNVSEAFSNWEDIWGEKNI